MLPTIPDSADPAFYYLCVGAAVFILGLAKSGFGGGIGILSVPLMAAVMPVDQMQGIMLPLLVVADVLSNLFYLKAYEWRLLKGLLPGLLLGVAAGTGILHSLHGYDTQAFQSILSIVVGIICLVLVLMQAYRLTGKELPMLPTHPLSAIAVGLIAGAISTLAHAAGPIVTVYLLQEKITKRKFMGTILLYFLIGNCAKLPTYLSMHIINGQTLRNSIWLIPILPLGVLAGVWINKRLPEKPFTIVMYVFTALAAGAMIYKAVA